MHNEVCGCAEILLNLAGLGCATALRKGTSLPQQSLTLVPSTPRFQLSWKEHGLKPNMLIRFYIYIKTHKTEDYQKFKVHFLFRFFCQKKKW